MKMKCMPACEVCDSTILLGNTLKVDGSVSLLHHEERKVGEGAYCERCFMRAMGLGEYLWCKHHLSQMNLRVDHEGHLISTD